MSKENPLRCPCLAGAVAWAGAVAYPCEGKDCEPAGWNLADGSCVRPASVRIQCTKGVAQGTGKTKAKRARVLLGRDLGAAGNIRQMFNCGNVLEVEFGAHFGGEIRC